MTTVLDASKALLVEVANVLNRANVNYVVVGGWSPYLRYKGPLQHPGTKDVDILFSDATVEGGISQIIELFLKNGFLVSAKHDFQLLKPISVEGRELVFNVDLLHPSETHKNPELLVDHLDLHINESDLGDKKFVKSVVLPSSQILFEKGFFGPLNVQCPITSVSATVPLITECGCILSKCESVKLEKRKRDAFDIYLSLCSVGTEDFAKALRPYAKLAGVASMLDALREYIKKKVVESEPMLDFDYRVYRYAKDFQVPSSPAALVAKALDAL